MGYWSIICPTMWRSKGLQVMVEQQKLLDNPDIAELLLIDNDPTKAVKLEHPKIRVIYSGQNIFVNPAWNWGVHCATTPNIALLSDDIIFDPSVFSQLRTSPNAGVIGLGEGCDRGLADKIIPKKYKLIPCTESFHRYEAQFGMLMLMNKAAYRPIPEEAKIYLGDVWLYDWNHDRGATNYIINNLDVIMQRGATSSAPDLVDIGIAELKNARYYFEKHFPNRRLI